jgi:hypothetical protein
MTYASPNEAEVAVEKSPHPNGARRKTLHRE